MYRTIKNANYDLKETDEFIGKIPFGFFNRHGEIFITRSPGRLDVMGGIADYSGSLVLQMPIAEAVFAALQKRTDKKLKIFSKDENEDRNFEMSLDDFFIENRPIDYLSARDYFRKGLENHWAAYVAGVFLVLMREKNAEFDRGANIFISSDVPQGKGVSSSAALEAAAMSAVSAAFEIEMDKSETAVLCQKVENLVVGAPCGIMDQMAVILGKKEELLSLVCQSAEVKPGVQIPDEIGFWGIDSGIHHSVIGADYGHVRAGAFMGYRIIADLADLPVSNVEKVEIKDETWKGYLANIDPTDFEELFAERLPKEISGAEFLEKYIGTTDSLTNILPEETYEVFYPTAHPIYENARVRRFAELLGEEMSEQKLAELGEVMFASHESYSACGLGTERTDLIVDLVKQYVIGEGLYGAKITGGGSGGTVVVLGLKDAFKTVEKVSFKFEQLTGHKPYIFKGSSPGAADFGFLKILLNRI